MEERRVWWGKRLKVGREGGREGRREGREGGREGVMSK